MFLFLSGYEFHNISEVGLAFVLTAKAEIEEPNLVGPVLWVISLGRRSRSKMLMMIMNTQLSEFFEAKLRYVNPNSLQGIITKMCSEISVCLR
jgi:hypothetical protein